MLPNRDPGAHPYDRNARFNAQNHDKLSIAMDLKRPRGRELLHELARASDIVIANFAHGVLERLGASFAELQRVNPRIIVVEMPAFGSGGPAMHRRGMGMTMEAAAGMTGLMGYGDGKPIPTGPAYLDPIGGLHAVAAVLTALHRREQTGSGMYVEVAQTEAASHWIGEFILEQLETGSTRAPTGNRTPGAAPHDAFPCLGTDEWVTIECWTDGQWEQLCKAMERRDLLEDPRFRDHSLRSRHESELYAEVSAWTATKNKDDVAWQLQSVGIPSAPVRNGSDIATDPELAKLGLVIELDHGHAGRHKYSGLAFALDKTPGEMRMPAPFFGQHNQDVLIEVLGMTQSDVEALLRAGILADRPAGFEGGLDG
jgi:crotonobetainyl-CoA:carnitine CoA-transferase CaiB-like acyl-CoA transferase